MFGGFEDRTDKEARKRTFASVIAAATLLGLAGIGVVWAAGVAPPVVAEPTVEVVFREPPPVAEPAAEPPPSVPEDVPVKRSAAPAPAALVEPTAMPTRKQEEATPTGDAVEIGTAGGEGSGTGHGGGSAGTAPIAIPVTPKKANHPINLPESATPPVASADNISPEYPEEARAQGLEGQVILKIVVSETGAVTRVELLRGDEPFASVAIAAVRSWHYEPALVDGEPTAVFRIVKIPFRLKS